MIQNGEKIISSAYDSGYQSLSGFSDSLKPIMGAASNESRNTNIITLARLDTPLGPMFAGATDEGLCLLEFTDRRMLETGFRQLTRLLDALIVPGTHPLIDILSVQLNEYFDRKRTTFDLPLCAPGTGFQKSVWEMLLTIPYGETRSYKRQAGLIGKPDSVRAVANANGCNRISILIPCHRVIGEDGSLTGYGGGLWRKKRLLDLENGNGRLF